MNIRKGVTQTTAVIVVVVIVAVAAISGYAAFSALQHPSSTTASCGGTPPSEIKIGASLPLTGGLGSLGQEIKGAYLIAVNQTNAAGGLYIKQYCEKLKLSLTILDDGSTPANAITNYNQLITVDKVNLLLGEIGSSVASPTEAVANQYKIPVIENVVSAATPANYTYVFVLWPTPASATQSFLNFTAGLPSTERPHTVYIWRDTGTLAASYYSAWETQLPAAGLTIVGSQSFTTGTTDFSGLITATKNANPDVIFMAVQNAPDAVNLVRQMQSLNYTPKLGVFGVGGVAEPAFASSLGNASNNFMIYSAWEPTFSWPGNVNFSQIYEKTYNSVPLYAGDGYATCQVLFAAVVAAGTLNTTAIDQQLYKTNMMTVVGPVTFTQPGSAEPGRALSSVGVGQWEGGVANVVYPAEIATTTAVWPMPPWS